MTTPSREDIALYMMGEYDGDRSALEVAIADDPDAKVLAADEAGLEVLLRDAAAAASFCPGCGDLVRGSRCDACGAAVTPGGYVVERVLVSNAHGRMYVAHDADGTRVALKELAFVQSPSLEVIAAFEREAKFLRALEHPAIPRFVASFEEGSGVHVRYYLAQELVTGESLEARLEEHWFTEAEIVGIARQVLEVLVYLQSVSPMVIHRDIKPANLIRRDDGTIAVVDFGAAHVQGTTAGSTSIGTFGYMPIEQLAGLVDATTDVYALGASLVHLLGRREPWRILHGESLDGINVSSALRGFLRKLVAHDPRERFANAAAALAALGRLGKERVRSWHRPFAVAAAATVAVLASGIGIHAWMARSSVPEPEAVMPAIPHDPPPQPESVAPAVQHGPEPALLRIDVPQGVRVELFVDGARIASAQKGTELPLAAGGRTVKLVGPGGRTCEQHVMLAAGTTTTLACALAGPERGTRIPHADADHPQGRYTADQCMLCHKSDVLRGGTIAARVTVDGSIPPGKQVDLTFKAAPLQDVLRQLGTQCGLNVVVPESVAGPVTVSLSSVPCDQALEVLLQSRGLWYRYRSDGNLLRVADRHELDRDATDREDRVRRGVVDDVLPDGPPLDLDVKDALIRDVLQMLAKLGGINIVIPDSIGGKMTVRLKAAPWGATLQTMLEANGLWYRYRANGKLLRIADRHTLDREN